MNSDIFQKAKLLGTYLLKQGKKVSTAESCTGGGIAKAITDIPGSSAWFDLALVTYSNAMKTQMLSVSSELLQTRGAVSEAVVRAMHAGALTVSGADLAVAVSGVAGPGGGGDGKPVGTVFIAWGDAATCLVAHKVFAGDREAVREQTVTYALEQLISFLQK